jgi:Ca2+/Na+ antiporter
MFDARVSGRRYATSIMIHLLVVLAVVLFVLWLLFHAAGAMWNLIWIAIVVLAVLWLFGLFRGRSSTL